MTRKVVDGTQVSVKDERGAYVPSHLAPRKRRPKKPREPKASEVNLKDLIDKNLLILYRETRKLMVLSASDGLLGKDSAHSVRENLKLMVDLKKKEKEVLDEMSDEDIKKLIETKLNDVEKPR